VRGDLDASRFIYLVLVVKKTLFLILCNSFPFVIFTNCSLSYLFFFLIRLRRSSLHLGTTRNTRDLKMKKMKRHTKRHANFLYCNHKIKVGDVWKTMQPLGDFFLKKLTHVTRLIETSLVCAKITKYFLNQLYFQ
jgi:hypothetical protein